VQAKLIGAYDKEQRIERLVADIDSSLAFEISKVLTAGEVKPRIKIGERFTSHRGY
jgi:hypothetical protein